MKHFILIERWKREACEIEVEADNAEDAENKALEMYFDDELDDNFDDYGCDADYKEQVITVYNSNTHERLRETEIE